MSGQGDGLNGSQKVAAVLLAIDPQLSSKVLQHMGEDQLEQVTRAMKQLEETAVGENDLRDIFKEAVQRMRGAGLALGDVGGVIRSVLIRAFGEERGNMILQNVEQNILAQRPFAVFDSIPAEDLANLLSDEHPQIVAVFLAHLDASKAGGVVGCAARARARRRRYAHRPDGPLVPRGRAARRRGHAGQGQGARSLDQPQ